MLVPIVSTAAKQSLKKPLWNMLKFGALPWALDQAADLMSMDLKTQEPDSTKNPNDETTAKLNLNEQIENEINTNNILPNNPPNAPGNVNLNEIEGSLPDTGGGDGDAGDIAGAGEDDDDSEKQKL